MPTHRRPEPAMRTSGMIHGAARTLRAVRYFAKIPFPRNDQNMRRTLTPPALRGTGITRERIGEHHGSTTSSTAIDEDPPC